MNRIKKIFKNRTEKVIPYITAGYPEIDQTLEIVLAAEKAGADMIELGMPFSDPIADGPVIQYSSQAAINNGVTVSWILDLVSSIRKQSEIPITLMGYINPILKYGLNSFLKDAKSASVDGFIIPDLLEIQFYDINAQLVPRYCHHLFPASNTHRQGFFVMYRR